MNYKNFLAALVACGWMCTMLFGADLEHTKDTLDVVKSRVEEKKAVLVDVRDASEWKDGHVQDALHLPLADLEGKIDEVKLREKLPKDKIIYTHCAAGYRSLKAGKILVKYGYDVRPLKSGYDELIKAGFKAAK